MKQPGHVSEAEAIGQMGFTLLHFTQIPKIASKAQQVEALRADAMWVRNHTAEICDRIDALALDIEFGAVGA